MADFDEKLNQILSNPDAMAQIARLAQSLNGPPSATQSRNASPSAQSRDGSPSAQSRDGSPVTDSGASDASQSRDAAPDSRHAPPPDAPQSRNAPPDASGDTVSVPDAPAAENTIARFLPLLQELGGDSDARRLLYALRPYLRPQKQEKVERALHLARLFRVGKKFLSQWEG